MTLALHLKAGVSPLLHLPSVSGCRPRPQRQGVEEEGADDCQDDVSVGSFHKADDVACGVEVPSLLLSPADFCCLAVYHVPYGIGTVDAVPRRTKN